MNFKKNLIIGLVIPVMLLSGLLYSSFVTDNEPTKKLLAKSGMVNLVSAFNNSFPIEIERSGEVIEYTLEAAPSQIQLSESLVVSMWTYNGQLPGPELRIQLGQTIRINFTNNLPQETTIHFHGVRVPNAMDGVPGVTQPPIQPGGKFTYEFTPKDAGTYWYHPHVRGSEQVERGLYGTIIVEDPVEPIYSNDVTWVLDDLLLDESGEIYPYFNTPHDLMHDGRWGNLLLVNGQTNYTHSFNAGDRVRLRLLNASNARVYRLDLGELDAVAFAVDGLLAQETFNPQGFELSPGNRINLDISIPAASRSKPYYIRDTFTGTNNRLVSIQVNEKTGSSQDFTTPTAKNYPDWTQASEIEPFHDYRLNAHNAMGHMRIRWTMDGKAFPEDTPIELEKNQFYKLRFTNESYRLHPMHIHGQFFKVLARNGVATYEPFWRDTVLIKNKETVDIGLVPLDEGEWANHCHILEHAESGMMTTVLVN